jgi:glycosyltransferase involved in cell wall biosynthesis
MDKTRVLYVGNHAGYFLTHRLPVFRALQDVGYDVHVAVPAQSDALGKMIDDNAVDTIRRLGFEFHNISIKRGSVNPINEIFSLYQLFRLYKTLKPDLVYHSTIKPVLYGGLLSRIMGIPGAIFGVTGLGYLFVSSGYKSSLLRIPIRLVFAVVLSHPNAYTIFQNEDDYKAFIHQHLIIPEKAVVIKGSGVDLKEYCCVDEPSGVPVVVLISRMLWDKGVGEFVEAAKILRNDGVQGRFVLVGDSDPNNPASIPKEQLQTWHDSGLIEWWGWRADIPLILRQSHIVSLPSYREGVPKALIEAAASGRPIVTTDVPGCREVVQNKVNGFLVPPKDAQALANAIKQLMLNAYLRQEMGRRGRELAEMEFSVERVVSSVKRICDNLLN